MLHMSSLLLINFSSFIYIFYSAPFGTIRPYCGEIRFWFVSLLVSPSVCWSVCMLVCLSVSLPVSLSVI